MSSISFGDQCECFPEPPQGLSRCCQGTPFLTTQARGQPKVLAGDFWAAPESICIELLVILLLRKIFQRIQVHPIKNITHD